MLATTLERLFLDVVGPHPALLGLAGGVVIAALNAVGALLVLVWRNPSRRTLDIALGFAAGVMLTASFTSLIIPGVEAGGVVPVIIGMVLGIALLDLGDRFVPHTHPVKGREGGHPDLRLRRVWLLIIAITLHNMPEGLAVGIGFGGEDIRNGIVLMIAIGIQNIPEGFAVAVAALNAGKKASYYALIMGLRAGLVEIPLAVLGAWAVTMVAPLLPYAMGFAAGAMLYVIAHEILPEPHRTGNERPATYGTMVGVIVMLYLDVTLG